MSGVLGLNMCTMIQYFGKIIHELANPHSNLYYLSLRVGYYDVKARFVIVWKDKLDMVNQ